MSTASFNLVSPSEVRIPVATNPGQGPGPRQPFGLMLFLANPKRFPGKMPEVAKLNLGDPC